MNAGFDEHVVKPVRSDVLLRLLATDSVSDGVRKPCG